MSILRENIDSNPHTDLRDINNGQLRVKADADYLDGYFNGSPNYVQVKNITRGKVYDVVCVRGHGDCEDVTVIDDAGNHHTLADFFFEEL